MVARHKFVQAFFHYTELVAYTVLSQVKAFPYQFTLSLFLHCATEHRFVSTHISTSDTFRNILNIWRAGRQNR